MWGSSETYVTENAELRSDLLGEGTLLFPIDLQGTFISWPNFHDESSFTLENQNIVSWGSFCDHEGKSSAFLATTSTNNSSYNNSRETTSIESSKSMARSELSLLQHDDNLLSCLNSTKRSRSNEDLRQVFGRNVKPRTIRRLDFSSSSINGELGLRSSPSNNEEEGFNGETTCSILNPKSNGIKMRSSRGTATDSQSLYARKRRERINERLRILQSIIPNGTKVDISTMLDEAVHYVKFLQLQIRLLSSDEMWTYAPIAYSGMDRTNVDSWT